MGSGSWTHASYDMYTTSVRGVSADSFTACMDDDVQDVYRTHHIASELDPKNVLRECCDSEEHPNTVPVILALDVTGSMGSAAVRVAKKLNEIMTSLYTDGKVKDIEFCIMGIGDLSYDSAPIQISQFESDVRIAEQLDKIYFEGRGGGNSFESYSAAWYMGVNHCKLDCWKRGTNGIIITMGDELPNPYLKGKPLAEATGDSVQGDVTTKELLAEAQERFDIYHISIDDENTSYSRYKRLCNIDQEWKDLLHDNYSVATLDNLAVTITDIITRSNSNNAFIVSDADAIRW